MPGPLLAAAVATALCPALPLKDLPRHLRAEGETKIVFFASWCTDCKTHLTGKQPPGTLFIAAFDEPDAAAKVMRRFRGDDADCYTGDELATRYDVKSLPAVVHVDPTGTPRG